MDAFPVHLKVTGPATPPPLYSQPVYSLPNYKDNLHVPEESKIISAIPFTVIWKFQLEQSK